MQVFLHDVICVVGECLSLSCQEDTLSSVENMRK